MNRQSFLKETGYALAGICLSCVACTKRNAEEMQEQVPENSLLFTINLNTQLQATGDFLINKNVLVVRLANTNELSSFTAVQRDCTHAGGFLYWDPATTRFICPVHGSEFSATGVVLTGPAVNNLKRYKITIENNQLLITS